MQNLNKRGFSPVIQITILSALSIISLLLIWGYVSDLSSTINRQLSPAVDCISQKSKIKSACLNEENKIELNTDFFVDEKINFLNLKLEDENFVCGSSCESCKLDIVEKNKIYLSTIKENPKTIFASINGCMFEEIQITRC